MSNYLSDYDSGCLWGKEGFFSPSRKATGCWYWVFIGRTDVEAEIPILWPPDVKSWPIWKDPDAGKDWGQEEKETTEDEMVGWHHRLNGHRFGWTLGVGDGQGGLACCSSWGCNKSVMTEWLNWINHKYLCKKKKEKIRQHRLYSFSTFPLLLTNGEGHGNRLQYSCLENPTDRGSWRATVHGVAQSWTRLSN